VQHTVASYKHQSRSGGTPTPKGQGYFNVVPSRVKKAVLVLLKVFSLKISQAEGFAVPFKVLN